MKYFCLLCAILLVCCVPVAAVTYDENNPLVWGSYGSGNGEFILPSGIAVDRSTDEVYTADACPGADSNRRVQKCDKDGEGWFWWTGEFTNIIDLEVAVVDYGDVWSGGVLAGDIYVSDVSDRILRFDSTGFPTGTWGGSGTGDGQFRSIGGLGVDSSGNIYVADTGNHRIQKFDPMGGFLCAWGSFGNGEDQFNGPTDVAVDRTTGDVYVADAGNHRVQKFTSEGTYPETLTESQDMQFQYPKYIATGAGGRVFVTDEGTHTVHMIDTSGDPPICWGGLTLTNEKGKFWFPQGVAVDSENNVYVADRLNHRVQKFAPVDGPTAEAGGPYSGYEGAAVTFSAEGSTGSAGTGIALYEWDFDNDGEYEASASTLSTDYTWDDDFEGTITLRVTDTNGNTATDTATVTIRNVAPTDPSIDVPLCPPMSPVRVGTEISASVRFTDPGIKDTHTVVWNWDDGSESSVLSEADASGALTVTTMHTYTTPGIYSPSVSVTDKDGGTGTSAVPATNHIVVYDPNGGFATGGGWFDSPAGACTPEDPDDADIVGKTHFAFVSKYKTDATVPESSVEFSLKQAKIDFKSTSVTWLVVAGSKATYTGVGTLNGAGGYDFLLSATDNPASGDKVRMKVWDASGVIYDTQPGAPDAAEPMTRIGGGSIVVHP